MAIPLFLAAHPLEVAPLPQNFAWMACHFSEKGLTDLPQRLPKGAMVILTDEIPPRQQEPELVAEQLATIHCGAVLLDFQRPGCERTAQMASAIVKKCHCPVGVTEYYAEGLQCPVFLSPVPPDRPLEAHLNAWKGRELWLDLSPSPTRITVTAEGSRTDPLPAIPAPTQPHQDLDLCCHYCIATESDRITFDLWRTREDLAALLSAAKSFGATRAVGLYQELGSW